MKFVTYLLMLLLLCVAACDKRTRVTIDGIILDFSGNLEPPSQKRISEGIIFQLKILNPKITHELTDIVKMRIDSIPFAYIFFIPFRDSIKGKTKEAFDHFAVSLSEDQFENTPVHIILTDNKFNPLREFPFHKAKVNFSGYGFMSSRTDIYADSSVPKAQLDSIEVMLLSELSELYNSDEKVIVDLMTDKGIDIEITVDDARINKVTLMNQLAKMNRAPWSAIFDGRPFRFIVKNKSARVIYKSM